MANCRCDIEKKVAKLIKQIGSDPALAIPLLQAVQNEFRFIPKKAIEYIAAHTDMTETQLYGAATFYSQFRL